MKLHVMSPGLAAVAALLVATLCCCEDADSAPGGGSGGVAGQGTGGQAGSDPDGGLPDGAGLDGGGNSGGTGSGGSGAQGGGGAGPYPIMIAAATYAQPQYHAGLYPHRPYIVYAWCSDPALERPGDVYAQEIGVLESITNGLVEKMIMFSSNVTLNDKLSDPSHVQHLHDIGVTTIGYNSEGGLTPPEEMSELDNPDPSVNSVARFAATAEARGFDTIWGPIRMTADAVSDQAVLAMFGAGLDGVALQEQQFIDSACVDTRALAVGATAARYRSLAGGHTIHVTVQIMPSTCLDGDEYARAHETECGPASPTRFFHCAGFVEAVLPDADSIAIWAMGADRDDLAELIALLRQ